MAHHFRRRQEEERARRARSGSSFVPDEYDFTGVTAALGRPRRNMNTSDPLATGQVSWEKALEDFSERELFWAELPNLPVNQSQASSPRRAPPSENAHSRFQESNVSEIDSVIGDANDMDDDNGIHMSEDQGADQVSDDDVGISEQYRTPTPPMFHPNVFRRVPATGRTLDDRVEQARRAFPGLWRQPDRKWLDQQVSEFSAELEENGIKTTEKDKAIGRLALQWLARRLELIS